VIVLEIISVCKYSELLVIEQVISAENQRENRLPVFWAVESLNGFQHALFIVLVI
jgi:hypothetical protein